MLSTSELESLQNLISDENKTFEDLRNNFELIFDKSLHFKVYLVLSILIKEHQLNLFQELSGLYILYSISEQEKDYSSFSSFVIEVLKETKINSKKLFLIDLLNNKITDYKLKIKEYLQIKKENADNKNIEEEINKIELNIKNKKSLNIVNEITINPLVSEKKILDNEKGNNNAINFYPGKESLNMFLPNYMSYYPIKDNELLFKNELKWILPTLKHNFIWENNSYEKVYYLLNQILNDSPVTKDETKYIISSLNKNQNIIKCINFGPNKMMSLIEKDESLSFEILSIVCKISLNE